jgi:hypothetical protein
MSDEERDLDMDDESGEDEIDVGTNETDSLNYDAVAGMQNDHRFGNFAIPNQINSMFMSEVCVCASVICSRFFIFLNDSSRWVFLNLARLFFFKARPKAGTS